MTRHISRRQAILGVSAAVLTTAALPSSALAELLEPALPLGPASASNAPPESAADTALDDRLRKELADMSVRADSEEGVPVMLALFDLAPGRHTQKLGGLSPAFAAELHRNAASWERVKPGATEADIGNLIQVLAARDFADGGTGGQR